jgi:hypothetical protein
MKRIVCALAVAALAGALGAASGSADTSSTLTNPKYFFWAGQTADANSLSNDLIYHGGNVGTTNPIGVETKPAVYLVYWGTEWAQGFKTPDTNGTLYSSKTLQNYVNSFFSNVGGSPWAGVQTQYCRNVPAGTTSCTGIAGAQYVTNPTHQLKGVWTDATPVPNDIITLGLSENLVDDPLAMEAMRASAHFNYDPNATYIILTPPRPVATGQPVYCGYHTQTTSIDGLGNPYRLQYAFIPFLNTNWPGFGTGGCGMHNVNAKSDSFGNGIFDGYKHRHRARVLGGRHRPGQLLLRAGRLERRPDERERRQVRLVPHAEHLARRAQLRCPADVEQRGVRRRQRRLSGLAIGIERSGGPGRPALRLRP